MRPIRFLLASIVAFVLSPLEAQAQTRFGTSCAGASGATPELAISGTVESGQTWTLEVTAPGGIGLGYLLVGFSNTSASSFGGVPLPLDFGTFFGDPLWAGCELNVDPNFLIHPYTFDPNVGGGGWTTNFPGFDTGHVFIQALNIDPDFVARIAGMSQGVLVANVSQLVPDMVPIPSGTFAMGSNAPSGAPYFGGSLEQPVHTVTISQPFWMGQHEVTQAEYLSVMGSNPSLYVGANRPVERVSWFDAVAYCEALTVQQGLAGNLPPGYVYRLPTEAEWEYACRAGTTTEFGVGNGVDLFCSDAWFSFSNHSDSPCGIPSGTIVVESFAPNAWGLFDMHGNVWEWCLDSSAAYPVGPVTDPLVTGGPIQIIRGGSWSDASSGCRSAERFASFPAGPLTSSFGFRVVLAHGV